MSTSKEIRIESATYVSGYKLKINFSDGVEQTVDFEGFIVDSRNPDINRFANKKLFKEFQVVDGDLMWGDFELIFPISDLHKNSILKDKSSAGSEAS